MVELVYKFDEKSYHECLKGELKYDSSVVFVHKHIHIYHIPPPLTVHFPMTRSVRYQPICDRLCEKVCCGAHNDFSV